MDEPLYKLVYSDNAQTVHQKQAPGSGKAYLRIERKGRNGKTVTIVGGLSISDDELLIVLKEMQKACGTGGTVKERHIELQGDFRNKVRPLLEKRGYAIK